MVYKKFISRILAKIEMPIILDGKRIAQKLKDKLKLELNEIKSQFKCVPGLAVIQVGNVAASLSLIHI